ncbi:MAG TPA: 3-deoxy-manno-octulosonate cytidylyltransferase [Stellaceae bacterium]|nr:3-deoxy-manno-octulosonate cytidylyltransferase [Stellaceae bacterium]
MDLSPLIIIPARMASTRLPGKPLAVIAGEAMIVHVWRRAVDAGLGPVLVACAEREIAETIEREGGQAVLTRPDHPSGSDRVFEALNRFDAERRHQVVINVQGDLPAIDPAVIRASLAPLREASVDLATLAARITEEAELSDPNVVKVAAGFAPGAQIARALYFSRLPIPHGTGDHYHHIGLYAWRRAALEHFVALPPSVLERRESLEQLRALEAGMRIDVALVDTVPFGVDTDADLARARTLLEKRALLEK